MTSMAHVTTLHPPQVGPRFQGRVHGFELNPRAASIARRRCNQLGLNNKYKVTAGRSSCKQQLGSSNNSCRSG
jgi:hypothetical protein